MIPHNKPTIGKEEIRAVEKVLKSEWIAEGNEVKEFEDSLCQYLGWKPGHAIAFSSGTAALYVVLISLDIKDDDEVITSTYVCSAVLNAIYLARAKPILVDINDADFNISFEETKKKINSKTKAIIVPHIFGIPADVNKFLKLGIPIIEDCAQAIGAKLNGKHLGIFGKVAIFSFYASKVLTTGYGGMVFSKDKNFIEKVRDYREFDCRKEYKPRFNFQMSDFQAAMGRVQLKKLPSFLKKRKKIADEYYKILPPERVWPPKDTGNKKPNFYRFLVRTDKAKKIKDFLEKREIKTIIPIETYELLHRYLGQNPHNFPISENVAKTTLSLPIYPSLTNLEIKKIKSALKEYFSQK
jgi:perosamine synthetase